MGASQSNLSGPGYGYDFVMAVTQASINTQMKTFLSTGTMPVVNICYVADAKANPTPIDYETLKKNAKGSDPFLLPDGVDPSTNQDFKNLLAARFMVGFRAQIGLPPGYAPAAIPDVVTLGADTASVTFNLMCSEFIVVQLNPGGGFAPVPSWMNQSQPDGNAWLFTSQVDMRMFATDPSKYHLLPPAVQKQIANLGGDAFSVQQLLFDLDNAVLESIPKMSGVTPGTTLHAVLLNDFLGTYFAAMQAQGAPILGSAITQAPSDPSQLDLSSLQFQVSPLLNADGSQIQQPTQAQQQLATLGYLCEADNDPPIAARAFGWNWIDPSDSSQGVVAVNRNSFRAYFQQQLTPVVMRNCYAPYTRVWLSGFFDQNVHYEWNMTPYQSPTVTVPATGPTVLQYHWSGYHEDQAGLDGDMGHLTLSTTMDCSVQFTGNTVVIVQHLVVYLYVKAYATGAGGNVIDKQITDTYTLSVADQGQIVSSPPSTAIVDNSDNPSTNPFLNFFVDAQSIINSIDGWISTYVATNLTDIPLSTVQGFIFPGGDTFAFHDAIFSDNQDLTGTITYGAVGNVNLATREMIAGTPGPRASMPVTRA